MRAVTKLFSVAAVIALSASTVQAQSCLGFASLGAGRMNINGVAQFSDGANSYGARLNMAHGSNHFIGLNAGVTTHDVGDSDKDVGVSLGWDKKSDDVMWCPEVGASYAMGGNDVNAFGLMGRVGIAREWTASSMTWVPFAWGGVMWNKPDCDGCDGDTNGVFGGGIGVRMSNGVQVSPQLSKSTATGSDVVFGATISIPFGKKGM
jgi:hypothetical protein